MSCCSVFDSVVRAASTAKAVSVALLNAPEYRRDYATSSHAFGWSLPMTCRSDGLIALPSILSSKALEDVRQALIPAVKATLVQEHPGQWLHPRPGGAYVYADTHPTPCVLGDASYVTAVNCGWDTCMVDWAGAGTDPEVLLPGSAVLLPPHVRPSFFFCSASAGQTLVFHRWFLASTEVSLPTPAVEQYFADQRLDAVEEWSVSALDDSCLEDVKTPGGKWLTVVQRVLDDPVVLPAIQLS